MAGNKKPRKQLGKLGKFGPVVRAAQQRASKAKAQVERLNMLRRISNATPLGHESNRYKIDATFQPLEDALAQIEATAELECDEDGDAVVRDPRDGETIAFGAALESSARIFARVAPRYNWPPMPEGMARAGRKVTAGMLLFDSDIADVRATIAWMRLAIEEITPNEWSEICDEELEIDLKPTTKEQMVQSVQKAMASSKGVPVKKAA
jgi:hypothetical protein